MLEFLKPQTREKLLKKDFIKSALKSGPSETLANNILVYKYELAKDGLSLDEIWLTLFYARNRLFWKDIANHMMSDPYLVHGVYGCFHSSGSDTGHQLVAVKSGSYFWRRSWNEYEPNLDSKIVDRLCMIPDWHDIGLSEMFNARIVYTTDSELKAILVRLIFFDPKAEEDFRGAHTCYTLFFSGTISQSYVPGRLFNCNPWLMIELFRATFPDLDRSEGKLQIDRNMVGKFNGMDWHWNKSTLPSIDNIK